MKLGIVVVYLVNEEDEKLLDLHLDQIEKHTQTPCTIYGSVNRLVPKFGQKLEQHPRVRICKCPTTDLRDKEEHSFYLEHLIRVAIEDGVSHVAILHVDSFPIRSGWAEELASRLSDSCVLAAIVRDEKHDRKPLTACLFFHRDFYLKYHPTLLLSEAERSSPKYKQYCQEFEPVVESGIGYGFKAYSEGLSWYPLLKSNRGEDYGWSGGIYDDLIFHLGGAVWLGDESLRNTSILRKFGSVLFLNRIKEAMKSVIPRPMWKYFHGPVNLLVKKPLFEHLRVQLFEDPESLLNYLRTGKA